MKLNKRLSIETIIVTAALLMIGYGWKIVQGMWLTGNYVPDIMNSNSDVDHFASQVSFGPNISFGWSRILVGIIIFIVMYYGARTIIDKMMMKSRK
ncbi:hypothetical protein BVG16_27235 [Paenibacillus selenitireducens]|uniref:Uncharacterized protein n=1 Tax=Paenibacillus selenitireducens TaxID=1324314 RepID=A0A1T2X1N2_9BACL|nr:hypothetical protein [Paenibacillus selenitireducens]OPA73779.1 hypothetical protein BVG16_27235 [Paenibacillus selenitireducens]